MGGRREGRRFTLLAALGLVLLVAGCLGGSGTDGDQTLNETDASDADVADPTPANETQTPRLGFATETAETTVSEEGTFTAGEGSFAGGGLRGTDTREHDLTAQVPKGVPVTVNVTISYDGEASQFDGGWQLAGVEIYDRHYVKDFATNTIWMEASLARTSNGGSVVAIVQADTTGEAPERSYQLDATIRGHGDATLPGVPTSVPVTEASRGFTVQAPAGGGPSTVSVWHPDGSVQRVETSGGQATVSLDEGRRSVATSPSPANPTTGTAWPRPPCASYPPTRRRRPRTRSRSCPRASRRARGPRSAPARR
jgi:hypothetical protein